MSNMSLTERIRSSIHTRSEIQRAKIQYGSIKYMVCMNYNYSEQYDTYEFLVTCMQHFLSRAPCFG